jgi:hypothetical protein
LFDFLIDTQKDFLDFQDFKEVTKKFFQLGVSGFGLAKTSDLLETVSVTIFH